MVSRPAAFAGIIIALFLSAPLIAQTLLTTSVDKDKLYQNEILNFTIQANTEIEISLGGLMNFSGGNVEAPKFDGLEDDWDIIDRQQSYNMQSINGNTQSTITWQYALSPKRTGTLFIPEATFKDAKSSPLTVDVQAGSRPRDESNPPSVFLRATVNKKQPYLQEQVQYTLQLFTLGDARGDMTEPEHPDFIIEPLGDTAKTYKMEYNRRYEVYERTYLLFPQKSGVLEIAPQAFTGAVVDPRTRRRARARELSNSISLEVKPPPASFSGDTWLPATSLHLTDLIQPDTEQLEQGDSITRTVSLSALGVLASALPEIEAPKLKGIKLYPDQPELNSSAHQQGVQSSRTQSYALVAVQEGTVEIPSTEVKWWDTVNDVERTAKIEPRTLTILPGNNVNSSSPNSSTASSPSQAPLESGEQQLGGGAQQDASSANSNTERALVDTNTEKGSDNSNNANAYWLYVAGIILTAWIAHATWLHRKLRVASASSGSNISSSVLQTISTKEVISSFNDNSVDATTQLYRWYGERNGIPTRSVTREMLSDIHPDVPKLVQSLEASRFSSDAESHSPKSIAHDNMALVRHIKSYAKKPREQSRTNNSGNGLKSFYPS